MSRLGKVHDDKGNSGGETSCEPLKPRVGIVMQVELEYGCDNDTD